ncbi:hypothetical protein AGR7B_Lc110116 [Agrobacterium deltaense RV3]|nr:hypothetical protein AGR7B_Lc110116 [Agrobacterium deltaense RV3]
MGAFFENRGFGINGYAEFI